jgi:hypothetical protein
MNKYGGTIESILTGLFIKLKLILHSSPIKKTSLFKECGFNFFILI